MERRSIGFQPAHYSDVPLYNIQAVAAATGVPAITLRSWERRYGIPVPRRDAKGYRVYSERDIAIARWLKERVQQGVGISRAVNMLRVLEYEEPPAAESTFDLEALRARLIDAIARVDEAAVTRVISEALMVASVEDVSLRLLQPALYDVGRLWEEGKMSVTSEHVGSNLIRSRLAELIRISPPPLRQVTVLVGCAPGEQHDIGALMLALFLRRRGFAVTYVGACVEPDSLRRDVERLQPDAICLSACAGGAARLLKYLYEDLDSSYDGVLGYGGRIFNEDGGLHDSMPGVYLGPDATTGVGLLERALNGRAAHL